MLQGAQIGRRFNDDTISPVDEYLADKIECLLGSGSNDYVVRRNLNPVAGRMTADHFA